jgi:thiamine-monophosphate kinase
VVHPKQSPASGDRSPTGEDAVLERIGRRLADLLGPPPPGEIWSGDDAAVITVPSHDGNARLVFTTDAVVGGVHVDLSLMDARDVGWKALTTAVSDIAAMGGVPAQAVVTVCAPPGTEVDEIAEGVGEAALRWRCPVVGGDLTGGAELVVSVAVIGTLEGEAPPVLRSGARPGDSLFVTGPLGRSAAGLRLLGDRPGPGPADDGARSDLEHAYRRPLARLDEGRAARDGGATAMMDISDGLGLDLHRLAAASQVGVVLETLPVADGATEAEALGGGEDYELLIAVVDGERLAALFASRGLRPPLRIGRCTGDPKERQYGSDPLPMSGYQHTL